MKAKGMKVKTNLKAGDFVLKLGLTLPAKLGVVLNHNETLVREAA